MKTEERGYSRTVDSRDRQSRSVFRRLFGSRDSKWHVGPVQIWTAATAEGFLPEALFKAHGLVWRRLGKRSGPAPMRALPSLCSAISRVSLYQFTDQEILSG